MANLNLDIRSIRNNIDDSKKKLKKYEELTTSFMTSLTNVDTFWKDNISPSFIEDIKKDNQKFLDLNQSITKYIDLSSKFCDKLEQGVSNVFSITTLNNIKYLENGVNKSKEMLDTIESKIDEAKLKLSSVNVPYTSAYYSSAKSIFNDLKLLPLTETKQDIEKFASSINNAIDSIKSEEVTMSIYELDKDLLSFKYFVQQPDLKNVDQEEDRNRYNVDKASKEELLDTEVDIELSRTVASQSNESVDTEETEIGNVEENVYNKTTISEDVLDDESNEEVSLTKEKFTSGNIESLDIENLPESNIQKDDFDSLDVASTRSSYLNENNDSIINSSENINNINGVPESSSIKNENVDGKDTSKVLFEDYYDGLEKVENVKPDNSTNSINVDNEYTNENVSSVDNLKSSNVNIEKSEYINSSVIDSTFESSNVNIEKSDFSVDSIENVNTETIGDLNIQRDDENIVISGNSENE